MSPKPARKECGTVGKRRPCQVRLRKGRWRVYLLRCVDGSLYCGITNELKARIATHNKGRGAKYTRSRLPVKLAYVVTVKTRSGAFRRYAKYEHPGAPGVNDPS
jgi:predicted GIY-YIG superfamily endonuclease